jgi:UDP-glucose-4-epimerase GalE
VTGGAGYVGSHCLRALVERGERVVVLDDLSEGHLAALPASSDVELVRVDLAGADAAGALDQVLGREPFDAVLHFGAKAYVGESVRNPGKYYRINVGGGIELLAAMVRNRVPSVIFSSTCATYGIPQRVPIAEDHPQRPVNPYGRTKLVLEEALEDFETAHAIRHVNLRYFNAAGAHESAELGEDHRPETHLVPLAIAAARGGPVLPVYGDDYDTPDGTCIRDYVHVEDLAAAHLASVDRLRRGGPSDSFNLGTGKGHSVLEVIEAVERVGGRKVPREREPRRPGDPPRLVAAADKARRELGFSPQWSELSQIVETAWRFQERFPHGYKDP